MTRHAKTALITQVRFKLCGWSVKARSLYHWAQSQQLSTMDTSPLGRLPGELRNDIWRHALVAPECIDVATKTKLDEPALLAVCKQIRKECIQIYYAENTFRVTRGLPNQPAMVGPTCRSIMKGTPWFLALGSARAGMITRVLIGGTKGCCHIEDQCVTAQKTSSIARPPGARALDFWYRSAARRVIAHLEANGLAIDALEVGGPDMTSSVAASWIRFKQAFEEESAALQMPSVGVEEVGVDDTVDALM